MKKLIARILTLAMILSLLGAVPVFAEGETGTIIISNPTGTGICIAETTFNLYQIFVGEQGDDFAVSEAFEGFFTGTLTDEAGKEYDFAAALQNDVAADATYTRHYADLAAEYITSYDDSGDMAILAEDIRSFIEKENLTADHSSTVGAHSDDTTETLTFDEVAVGYYFIMNPASTINGIGVAADGAFAIVENGITVEITVKNRVPEVSKEIYHDDENAWDVVGDYAIGDTVDFRITSTLPADISDYDDYIYILTDIMSEGITYNSDATVYLNSDMTTELSSTYYTVYDMTTAEGKAALTEALEALNDEIEDYNSDSYDSSMPTLSESDFPDETDFVIIVDAFELVNSGTTGNLYTGYSGTVNADALTSTDFENNTVYLTFSNNPHHWGDYGEDEDQVFGYSFELDVTKVDAYNTPLADVGFTLYDGNNNQLFLKKYDESSDYYDADIDTYYIVAELEDGEDGTITTNATGQFTIRGLNDATTYILKETTTPEGYITIDPIQFTINAEYNNLGVLTLLTSSSTSLKSELTGLSTTIINRKESILPDTGGIGTIIFQVAGVLLMIGAASILLLKKKKRT